MSRAAAVRARPLLDLLVRHRADPLGFLVRCAREDGDIVVFEMASRRLVVVNSPELVQEVLQRRHKEFLKAHGFETELVPWGRTILGHGLLVSEGEAWLRQRRLMHQAFERARMDSYGAVAAEATAALLAQWGPRERDIYADMSRLTLEILARTLFGGDANESALYDAFRRVFAYRDPSKGLPYLLPEWVPTPANVRTRKALRELDAMLLAIIAARRSGSGPHGDLLGLLLESVDGSDGTFDDRAVRDELMSTIVAGHDTLSATLTWGIDALASHPSVVERLRAELVPQLKGAAASGGHELPYLRSVVREILRLFPAGKSVVRVATQDAELGSVSISRGTFVVMSQWVIQRDPRWYPNPERFDPDRWAGDLLSRLPRFAYFPFGGGPRLCLGFAFAELALDVIISSVVQRSDLAGPPERRVWDPARLRPKAGVWLAARPVA
ncbi:MAG: cytochrome P450 [Chloroflexi bacterium]|nr:cytochrome P450 [Chloroflexota bacterium]